MFRVHGWKVNIVKMSFLSKPNPQIQCNLNISENFCRYQKRGYKVHIENIIPFKIALKMKYIQTSQNMYRTCTLKSKKIMMKEIKADLNKW